MSCTGAQTRMLPPDHESVRPGPLGVHLDSLSLFSNYLWNQDVNSQWRRGAKKHLSHRELPPGHECKTKIERNRPGGETRGEDTRFHGSLGVGERNYPWNLECFLEDLFLGGQWSIILGYRRLSVKSLLVCKINPGNDSSIRLGNYQTSNDSLFLSFGFLIS